MDVVGDREGREPGARAWCWRRGSDACFPQRSSSPPPHLRAPAPPPVLRFLSSTKEEAPSPRRSDQPRSVCLPSNNFSSRTGRFSQLRRNLASIVSRLRIVTHPHSRNPSTFPSPRASGQEARRLCALFHAKQRVNACVFPARHSRRLPHRHPPSRVLTSHRYFATHHGWRERTCHAPG